MEHTSANIEIGPQYPKDNPFAARMRFHQSWYRARVLKVPFGHGPGKNSSSFYGNYLTQVDGEQGYNFFTPQLGERIFTVVTQRLAENKGAVEPYRLLNNMLSSQPMCFNLFGPLVNDPGLAAALLKPLYPDEIFEVTRVQLEYAPEPAKEYLNDHTAFDAFIEFTALDGKKGFIGIETKLVERFSLAEHEHEEYWKWTLDEASPWVESTILHLKEVKVNQLWRDHLLGVAILNHAKSDFTHGHFLVVYHPGDDECRQSINDYQPLLKPGDRTFQAITLDQLIDCWKSNTTNIADRQWLQEFSIRYLELSASEDEFI